MAAPRRSQPHRPDPMPEIARLGEQIARRRIDLRLTQQVLADLAGVSRSTIQALEYGSGAVRLSAVAQVAEALGLHLIAAGQHG